MTPASTPLHPPDMRLATIRRGGGSCAVATNGERCEPVAGPGGEPFADVGALLAAGDAGLGAAQEAAAIEGSLLLADVELLRPVLEPGAVFCVGLNYASHQAETAKPPPTAPIWFDKLSRTLADPGEPLKIAGLATELDFEVELTLVIGSEAKDLAPESAWGAVAGVTLLNDVSARELQRERRQVFLAKNLERSTPVGPTVLTTDEIADFAELEFSLSVNGEQRQYGRAGDMLFDVPALLVDLSSRIALRPGDLIATGTPAGVAMTEEPPRWMQAGDKVEMSCGPIGTTENEIG